MSAVPGTPPFVRWLRRQRRTTWHAIFLCSLLRIVDAAPASDTLFRNPPIPAGQCRFATAPRAIDTLARPDAAAPSNTESNS